MCVCSFVFVNVLVGVCLYVCVGCDRMLWFDWIVAYLAVCMWVCAYVFVNCCVCVRTVGCAFSCIVDCVGACVCMYLRVLCIGLVVCLC